MNNPHPLETGIDDGQPNDLFEVTPDFLAFARKAFVVWKGSGTDPEKGNEIRRLALVALANRDEDEDEETPIPHTQGIDDERLESDARRLTGCAVTPRRMDRKELQAAADRLTDGRSVEDDILEAIKRREGKHLMGHHSGGFHQ